MSDYDNILQSMFNECEVTLYRYACIVWNRYSTSTTLQRRLNGSTPAIIADPPKAVEAIVRDKALVRLAVTMSRTWVRLALK